MILHKIQEGINFNDLDDSDDNLENTLLKIGPLKYIHKIHNILLALFTNVSISAFNDNIVELMKCIEKLKLLKIKYGIKNIEELRIIISLSLYFPLLYDLNWVDTKKITDMSKLFQNMQKIYNLDISNWDVSNVTNMSYMFANSDFNGDISNWDVSNVTNMDSMFKNTAKFNLDIHNWKINSNVSYDDIFKGSLLEYHPEYMPKFNKEIMNYLKQKLLNIILKNNPAQDDIHTWIRQIEDILTYPEAVEEDNPVDGYTPDYTNDMVNKALKTHKIKVFSSYEINPGIFVTPSRMEALSYAGNSNVYSKIVDINDVAWIDGMQGQYAPVK